MKLSYAMFFLCFLMASVVANAEFIVTQRTPYIDGDKHHDYSNAVIELALEKTRDEYGSFRLEGMPRINYVRTLKAAVDNTYPNLVFDANYEKALSISGGLVYINFPVDLGVFGYRVCFVNPTLKNSGKHFRSLDELKPYTFVHGIGWADTQIFRANGLKVKEVENYDGVMQMVASGRVDFFCRGANEVLDEKKQFKALTGLMVDETFMLVYPQPRFLYTNSKNTLAKERIEKGLQKAYADGSLQELWLKHFKENLEFTNLSARQAIILKNPLLDDIQVTPVDDFMQLLKMQNKK